MPTNNILRIGDVSDNGQVTIIDEDRLCYIVKSNSHGAIGVRTISKALLNEYIQFFKLHTDANADNARIELSGKTDIDKFEYGYSSTLTAMAKMAIKLEVSRPKEDAYRYNNPAINQIIFYGAPGTGKSHQIKLETEGKKVIRTTFHPDSDYSTFVGCYKPSMKSSDRTYSAKELVAKLKEIKVSGVIYPCQKFATKYWKSLKNLSTSEIKQILAACDFNESYNVEVAKGVAIGEEYMNNDENGKIVYSFTPQAFTNAYIEAWQNDYDVYLVIEEINRGNCAQIFGDLFQLLDRNSNGYSEYPILADTDLGNYLSQKFAQKAREDIPEEVKSGKKLILPSNLYIWATMNTSDQSLFPIDSAFKRRWDWKYVRIDNAGKGWKIQAKGKKYDWWDFLEKINRIIGDTTSSEDKKLGYFFCKTADGIISAESFVSKVVFYLWNDVFKDYEFEGDIFVDEDKTSKLSFDKFYITDANGQTVANEAKVVVFLTNLGVKFADDNTMFEGEEEDEDGNTASSSGRDFTKYSVNGIGRYGKNRLAAEAVKQYVLMNPDLSADTVVANWKSLGYIVPHFIETKEEHDSRQDDSKRSQVIPCGDTVIYVEVNGYGGNGKVDVLIEAVNRQDWGLTLSKVE